MSPQKIHLFDASLGCDTGHYENQNRAIVEYLCEKNIDVEVYSNKTANIHIHVPEKCHDIFSISLNQVPSILTRENNLEKAAVEISASVYEDLKILDKARFNPNDIILYHTSHICFLDGLLKWLGEFDSPPFFVCYLFCNFYDSKNIHQVINQESYQTFKKTFDNFSKHLKDKVYFIDGCNAGKDMYRNVLKFENSFKISHPCYLSQDIAPRKINQSNIINIGFSYKHPAESAEDFISKITSHFENLSHFVFHKPHTFMDNADYYNHLKELDLIVLVYDPLDYAHKNSGIFSECIGLGVTVLMPDHTLMVQDNEELELNQIIYDHIDPAIISRKILDFYKNREFYQSNSNLVAKKYRKERSVGNYITKIIDMVSQNAAA